MHNTSSRRLHPPVLAALLLAPAFAACAQPVVLSDSFTRVTGLADTPANGGFSSWGAPDNALGGAAVAAYVTTDAGNANQQTVDGSGGLLRSGRVLLDFNLATHPDILAAGGFSIRLDLNPDGGGLGRQWAALLLTDSASPGVIGGTGALDNKANNSVRLGLGVRNSGSLIRRINSENTGGTDAQDLFFGNGNPASAGFNEPVFDPATFDRYVAENGPDFNTRFESDLTYTLRVDVTAASFAAGAPAVARVFINDAEVDMDLDAPGVTPAAFTWGNTAGAVHLAFLGFSGANGDRIDNLMISAVPEPRAGALLLAGGLAAWWVRRRAR